MIDPVERHEIATALSALGDAGIVTGVRSIDPADLVALGDEEWAMVANAVPLRQHEFASGRTLLRQLLRTTGAIPVGPTRAPELPPGVVGSLAHDRDVVVAAVSRDPAVRALGIDVEPATPLTDDLARVILRADEIGLDAHLAFTLKEAAYKAWSNGGGRMLDHHDVRIGIEGTRFTATVVADDHALGGRFLTVAGRHLALVVVS